MTDDMNNTNTGGGAAMSDAALLRAAADDELTSEQRDRLDRHLSRSLEGHARIQFERELRSAVGRVMGVPTAPAALRAGVERIIESARDSEPTPEFKPAEAVRETGGVEALRVQTRSRSFWANRQAWMGALAAVLVVGVASVLVWQAASLVGVQLTDDQRDYRSRLVGHVASEHRRVIDPAVAATKLSVREPEEVQAFFRQVVGSTPSVPGLTEGTPSLAFVGAGNCHVPGSDGSSAHLRFDVIGPDGSVERVVSVFVKTDNGELPLEAGVTYAMDTKACGESGTRVLVWSNGGLVYFMVADAINDGCVAVLEHLGVARPSKSL